MKKGPPSRFAVDTSLLGGSGRWQNLGLWPAQSYDAACERLAIRVGLAADLRPGQRLLELGAGSGAGLTLWRERFGVHATGLDPDGRADVIPSPAITAKKLNTLEIFDTILAVDSAYHLAPMAKLATALASALEPGGIVALTTLTLSRPSPRLTWLLTHFAHIPDGALVVRSDLEAAWKARFSAVKIEPLTHEVLAGFAAHVATRRPMVPIRARLGHGWAKIAATAALARYAVRTGALDYVLVTARA